jgi:glycosyltransferase involved in cell wall biosynthesis
VRWRNEGKNGGCTVKLDLLLDLSGTRTDPALIRRIIEHLASPDESNGLVHSAYCILPDGVNPEFLPLPNWHFGTAANAIALSGCALEAAGYGQRPLVVVLGPALRVSDAAGALLESLKADPMFGFAISRVADEQGRLAKLASCEGDPEVSLLCRSILAGLPEYYIVPETVGMCFAIRWELAANLGQLDLNFRTSAGAWLHWLCRARRAGFRGIIVNRAVIPFAGTGHSTTFAPVREDYYQLHHIYPDIEYARQEFRRLSAHEYESLLSRAYGFDAEIRRTLLIDARGMPPFHNGTASCITGIMDGLAAVADHWRISVLAKNESSLFHRLTHRYPQWEIVNELPQRRFSIAVRLCQPWDMETLAELHGIALLNFYMMLDVISWDVLYNGPNPAVMDTAWNFMSEYADGILYNSNFSRERYEVRFPTSKEVRHFVVHHSFHPADYAPPQADKLPDDGYILVVGNRLDHKWVDQTVELLTTAFPFESVVALGSGGARSSSVRAVESGKLSDDDLKRLFSRSRIVVFPSFYEGFGFPVLSGLSCGKPVVARRSSLLEEVAARCRAPGSLYAFSEPIELAEVIGRLLAGETDGNLPLGAALRSDEEPSRWSDIADNMLEFINLALNEHGRSQWSRRARALQFYRAGKP